MSDYRFTATTSSSLASIRITLQNGTGYSGGTGGQVQIMLETDDGTSNHGPSGHVLAQVTIPGIQYYPGTTRINFWPLVTFTTPIPLTAGQIYHMVFANPLSFTNPQQAMIDFISVNAFLTNNPGPFLGGTQWSQMISTGGAWSVRTGFVPIMELDYSNGLVTGVGYMETGNSISGGSFSLSPTNSVKEAFTPKTSQSVSGFFLAITGASGVAVKITAGGAVVAQCSFTSTSNGYSGCKFSSPVSLVAGTPYTAEVTSSSVSYPLVAMRKGKNFGFLPGSYFGDGYTPNVTQEYDLPFYFSL